MKFVSGKALMCRIACSRGGAEKLTKAATSQHCSRLDAHQSRDKSSFTCEARWGACLTSNGLNALQNEVWRIARIPVVLLKLIQVGPQ